MDSKDFTQQVQQLRLDADSVADPRVREAIVFALNLVEAVATENRRLLEENQKLKEIIRQLKGDPPAAAGFPSFSGSARLRASWGLLRRKRRPHAGAFMRDSVF